MTYGQKIEIDVCDFWVKIVEFLQQNWALIEPADDGCMVYFITDTSGVFDRMPFTSMAEAEAALRRNGFRPFAEDLNSVEFLRQPEPPFKESVHPNGPIYSSGRFWK
jgi:hypothetical protein